MEPFDLSKHMNMPTAIIGGVVLFFIVRGVFQWFEDKEQPPVLPKPVVAKQTPPPMRDFTLESLAPNTGEDGKPLYTAINGFVFDLGSHPSGPSFYGPGNGYHVFTGRDATLMFAKMELNPEGVKGMTMDSLSNYDIDVMRDWMKYKIVGYLNDGLVPRSVASETAKQAAASQPHAASAKLE